MNGYQQCQDCIYNGPGTPTPCYSCEQPHPSNFTEEDSEEGFHKVLAQQIEDAMLFKDYEFTMTFTQEQGKEMIRLLRK